MKRSVLPLTGGRLTTKAAAVVLATATAASVAGIGATTPALSATGSECPDAFPVSDLAADQAVTGLTVTKGTVPGEFTGKVLGVMKDGIAPGLDMIMVRLGDDSSGASTVDKRISSVGIWQGMSGSPVYADDGRLIGAVSYGLSWGPSTVAGVTPAAEMQKVLSSSSTVTPRPTTKVDMPQRMQTRVVDSGAATARAADGGLSQLKIPFAMTGLNQQHFDRVVKKLDIPGVRMMRAGVAGTDAADAGDIVAGGNLAAAVAYGDITWGGVGTATMVCGNDIVGFGHPMTWAGPTDLSLHPADAVYVQEDPVGPGFKVANIGAPVGTIDQDRMAGIGGFLGAVPDASSITSHATGDNGADRTGESWVNLPDYMPDVALSQVLANEDRVFDGIGKGSGTLSYTVNGTREDGTPFTVTRSDVYASDYDLTWETVWDFYMTVARLEYNGVEDISITSATTDSSLTRDYQHAAIEDVSIRQGNKWVSLANAHRLALPAGQTAVFKVDLLTKGTGPSSVELQLPISAKDAGRRGWLQIVGGNDQRSGFGGRNVPVDTLLQRIESAPHNDDVIADMRLSRMRPGQHNVRQQQIVSTSGTPVDGGVGLRLRILGVG